MIGQVTGQMTGLHVALGLWLIVVIVGLWARPLLPVDETRYLAVAWDMWLQGNYLVPHLNGEPYSHKPPLLFWLMTGGWHLFGVNDWWPRLVAPLFGLGCLFFTARLACILWPERPEIADWAPVILFGCLFWTVFTTLTMFDMMLAFFALAALIGMVMAAKTGRWRGFVVAGVAIGFGGLAKGPAILLHIVPVALTAPWWLPRLADGSTLSLRRWYGGVGLSVVVGVAIGLAWAVPAGLAGGEAYRDAIFWGQSAGRIVKSFAHARPFWWYGAVLPVLILPWVIWPALWRAFRHFGIAMADGGGRVCVIWFAAAFVVFSLISGKQLHYLLPEFPALALLAAFALAAMPKPTETARPWLPVGALGLAGLLLMAGPMLPLSGRVRETVAGIETGWGGLLAAIAVLVLLRPSGLDGQVRRLGMIAAAAAVALYLAAMPFLQDRYDLNALASDLKAYEDAGKPIGDFGKYYGQYHFAGRLIKPIAEIGLDRVKERRFIAENPDGVIVAYYRTLPTEATPLHTYRFRRLIVAIWPVSTFVAYPQIGNRR